MIVPLDLRRSACSGISCFNARFHATNTRHGAYCVTRKDKVIITKTDNSSSICSRQTYDDGTYLHRLYGCTKRVRTV